MGLREHRKPLKRRMPSREQMNTGTRIHKQKRREDFLTSEDDYEICCLCRGCYESSDGDFSPEGFICIDCIRKDDI